MVAYENRIRERDITVGLNNLEGRCIIPTYTQQGPYTAGVTALTAAAMNAIEAFLLAIDDANISAPGGGQWNMLRAQLTTGSVKRIARATGGSTQTVTHNWGEQADIVLPYYNGTFGTAPTQALAVTNEGVNSFQVIGQSGYSWTVLYIKF